MRLFLPFGFHVRVFLLAQQLIKLSYSGLTELSAYTLALRHYDHLRYGEPWEGDPSWPLTSRSSIASIPLTILRHGGSLSLCRCISLGGASMLVLLGMLGRVQVFQLGESIITIGLDPPLAETGCVIEVCVHA